MDRKDETRETAGTIAMATAIPRASTSISPSPRIKTKDVPLKTFDELYGEVCSELRGAGKSIDLCEKMKVVQSDLKRIQVLLMYSSNVVRKFTNYIGQRYEGKSESKSRELLSLAKSLTLKEVDKAVELLTQALLHSPWRSRAKESHEEIQEFLLTRTVNEDCVQWLVNRIGVSEGWVLAEATKSLQLQPPPHDKKDKEQESSSSKSSPDHPSVNLLAEIYLERAHHLSERGDHEHAILDCIRAIICCEERGQKLHGFSTVALVGVSLKAMGYSSQATLVFHHALQLLRQDSTADNQTKSRETIKIVRFLKELNVAVSQGQEQRRPSRRADVPRETAAFPEDQDQEEEKDHRHKKSQEQEPDWKKVTQTFGQQNPILIAASDAVDFKYDRSRGRHAIAKKNIPPGATLIVDSPYSWSLYPEMYGRLCLHCCRKVVSGIPCQRCSSVVFCKWECWQRSEDYHKFECPILKGLDSSEALGEMAVLCYRTVCKTDVRVLERFVSQAQVNEEEESEELGESELVSVTNKSERVRLTLGLDSEGKLNPKDFSSLCALTANSESRPVGDIIKRTLAAIYLTLCLRYTGYFQTQLQLQNATRKLNEQELQFPHQHQHQLLPQQQHPSQPQPQPPAETVSRNGWNEDEELSTLELSTAASILRLSQGLSCNAYGMNSILCSSSSSQYDTHKLQPIEQLGGATYPTISIVNHSCNPNVFRFTWGNFCIVRSILEIQKGEEILDSYGPLFTTMTKAERKARLESQYFFKCNCVACEGNWSVFKDLKTSQACQIGAETIYKCPGCGKALRVQRKKDKSNCANCGQRCDLRKLVQMLVESERKYLVAKESLISTGKINADGETALSNHISILQKFLTSPHRLIVECQETLKLAWNLSMPNNPQ